MNIFLKSARILWKAERLRLKREQNKAPVNDVCEPSLLDLDKTPLLSAFCKPNLKNGRVSMNRNNDRNILSQDMANKDIFFSLAAEVLIFFDLCTVFVYQYASVKCYSKRSTFSSIVS